MTESVRATRDTSREDPGGLSARR